MITPEMAQQMGIDPNDRIVGNEMVGRLDPQRRQEVINLAIMRSRGKTQALPGNPEPGLQNPGPRPTIFDALKDPTMKGSVERQMQDRRVDRYQEQEKRRGGQKSRFDILRKLTNK